MNGSMDFAGLLHHYRNTRDRPWSCNELAREVGVDPSYISRLERGEREPPRRPIVDRLADCLGLAPAETDALLLAAGYAPPGQAERLAALEQDLATTLATVQALRAPWRVLVDPRQGKEQAPHDHR
jgi:transcriptional regulator with XRE-family HTH domain